MAFVQGMVFVIITFLFLALFLLYNSEKTTKKLEERLASQTVIIEQETGDHLTQEHLPSASDIVESRNEEVLPALPSEHANMESGLAETPIEGLSVTTKQGDKPVIRKKDGLSAFKAYRRPFDVYASDKSLISIVITDLGLSDVATESAIRTMPPEISLAISPYAGTIDFWIQESRARGHEIWLTLPLENKNYPAEDPGPHTMIIDAPERENLAKLDWLLSRGQGYVGFITGYEPAFMQSLNDMRPVIGSIYTSGLGFVDGSAKPGIIPQTMAVSMKAPYSTVNIWLDRPDPSQESLQNKLEKLEKISRENGFAVGIIRPLPVSYHQILEWIETLPDKNIALAPLSATTGY